MSKEIKSNLQPSPFEDKGLSCLNKKWLTIDEVCYILGISKRSCQSFRDRRILPFYQVGRKIFFKINDVDEFLERHHIRSNYQKGGVL
jgi:excisionase family DNA binding protein